MDSDYATAPPETGQAYLAMLSIDSLLNVVAAVEKLTDAAVDGIVDGIVASPDASAGMHQIACIHMVRIILQTLDFCRPWVPADAKFLQTLGSCRP